MTKTKTLHIDGDAGNTAPKNLLIIPQQSGESYKPSDNRSGYVGVSLDKRRGKWRAYSYGTGRKSLGLHQTIESAIAARAISEIDAGVFSERNIPRDMRSTVLWLVKLRIELRDPSKTAALEDTKCKIPF